MFGEDGFCDDSPHTARASDTQNRCDQMNYEDNQIKPEQWYQSLRREFWANLEFATDRMLASRELNHRQNYQVRGCSRHRSASTAALLPAPHPRSAIRRAS
jgi:hypothetical protein